MRVIVKTVADSPFMEYLCQKLPALEIVTDTTRNHFDTLLAAFDVAGGDAVLHLEDDIILTTNFMAKVEAVVAQRPNVVVNFFSMRSADLVGSRWDSNFLMNQCTYYPWGYSALLAAFGRQWRGSDPYPTGHRGKGGDTMVDEWLKSRRERHWIHVPSLVQHRQAKSRIGPRSSRRQSPTFVDPDL